ncbi:daphnetin O-methyltransferase 1-like [Oryza sativa Japonica Group]|uniref:O-methyltransferase n=2 Tax=Oryza sativa subsp. japonica TaxID=39947 RepID=Q2R8B6_ORYSJ|nr:flavonoid O-methyltransferase-like protein Os11g0303600 [Oryza sativa Japonica Group]AAX95191.1 O-methyltransferase [Oryza sativa Japonica Group]AAX96654.1 O-methyltransferase [Oryza sativa Japonica Group]ABA92281.1 O-methyltransferase family protein, expressed [Oryza sativa Japonica Group]BAF27929.1 Os11g0235500 [Oryza sativa Japonica Group]|eukprot:NP_001067566.1 Os11g0235500 [Oryza sativa Japonica Group]
MAGQANTIQVPTDAELLQAQADLWRHSFSYLTAMALRCAAKLGIPTAIHRLGGEEAAASLPDLMAALSLPASKQPFVRRLMRLLVAVGVFAADGVADERYRLTPLSRILVDGVAAADDHHHDVLQTPFVLTATSRQYVEAALGVDEWLRKDAPPAPAPVPSPFEDAHGAPLFDEATAAAIDPEFAAAADDALAAHDSLGIGAVLRECGDLLRGVASLTDCAGGDGATARAIAAAFPHIKCTVLDLPKVIDKAPVDDGVVNYVAGDMFHAVPPAQAVLLKLVLHFWSDDDCVKILSQCKKAIPSRKEGGKVIVIDILIEPSLGPAMLETQLLMDMAMMVNTRGRQRDESEWRDLFFRAGFSDYKIAKKLGARAVFEVYP